MHDLRVSDDPLRSADRLAAVRSTGLLDTGPEEPFDQLARLAKRLLGTPFAFVTVVDDRRSFWKSCVGVSGGARENPVGESFCQYVVTSGEPLVLGDVRGDAMTRENPSISSMGVVAWAGYPVRTPDGQVLGTFCVVDTVPRVWSGDDRELLATLAGAASTEVALRLTAAEARDARAVAEARAVRQDLLARTGELLVAGLDVEEVVATIARLVAPALRASVTVYLRDGGSTLTGRATHHEDPAVQQLLGELLRVHAPTLADPWGPGHVVTTGVAELVPDDIGPVLEWLPADVAAVIARLRPSSAMAVPLTAGGRALGALDVMRHDGSVLTPDDVDLVQEVANRVALALDNALLFAAEHDFAVRLQQAVLTPPPDVEGLEVVVRYAPAAHRAQIGGDWYDAFAQPDGALVLVIGDVVGHDTTAALAMGRLRGVVRAIGYDSGAPPSEVLRRADLAVRGLHVDTIATAVVARVVRTTTGVQDGRWTVRWSSAGHPPPLLLRTDGTVEVLAAPSDLLLGIRPETTRTDHEVVVQQGDTVLLFTDGLFERRGRDLQEAYDGLVRALGGLSGMSPDDLCDALLERLVPYPGEDDVALLALRAHARAAAPAPSVQGRLGAGTGRAPASTSGGRGRGRPSGP